jgi:hypothetical protein
VSKSEAFEDLKNVSCQLISATLAVHWLLVSCLRSEVRFRINRKLLAAQENLSLTIVNQF